MLVFSRALGESIMIMDGAVGWSIIVAKAPRNGQVGIRANEMNDGQESPLKQIEKLMSRDDQLNLSDGIRITVVDIRGENVRLGIEAPKTFSVQRKEVFDAIRSENAGADCPGDETDGMAGAAVPRPKPPSSFSPGRALEEPGSGDEAAN